MTPRTHLSARLLFLPLATFAFFTAPAQELRVVASDPSGLTVEYRPVLRRVSVVGTSGNFTVLDGDRLVEQTPDAAGFPDLRVRRELVVLPGFDGNRVSVLHADFTDAPLALAPIPRTVRTADGESVVYERGAGYDRPGFAPAPLVALMDVGVARDRILATLVLAPFQWDPAHGIARVYSRLVVRLEYGAPDPSLARRSPVGPDLHPDAINLDAARDWTLRLPTAAPKRSAATLATGDWYRFDVAQSGIYKLTKAWFASGGFDVSGIDPRTIKVYGGDGSELSSTLAASQSLDPPEVAIEVVGEDDGRFDDGDYVLLYAAGPNGWTYDSTKRTYRHFINRFTDVNRYLITAGGEPGKRMTLLVSLHDPNPVTPSSFTAHAFEEPEATNFLSSGKLWVGTRITPQGSGQTYLKTLDQIVANQPLRYRVQLFAQSEVSSQFVLTDGGTTVATIPMGTVDLGTDRGPIASSSGVRDYTGAAPPDGRSALTVAYTSTNFEQTLGGYVDWIEWFWTERFYATGDVLRFGAPDTSAAISYELNGFTNSDVLVFDVADPSDPARIADPSISGGTVRFEASTALGHPREYIACNTAALMSPSAPVRIRNSSLHESSGAEYVIITHDDLVDQAERLRAFRERPGPDRLSSLVVPVSDIYDEFDAGIPDPTAIRNFLAYTMRAWQVKPVYVLLFGDGHYDYLLHSGTKERIMVPVWESEESIVVLDTYPTDDYFGQVVGRDASGAITETNDTRVDIGIGRLPVQNAQQASDVVDKIIRYESQPELSPWKYTVTLVADDGLTSTVDEGNTHSEQSEQISRALPAWVDQKKVYIVSYPTENTPQGRRKPLAAAAIVDRFDQGTVVMNFTGHGSDQVWTHEQVFTTAMIPQLTNADRLTFVTAATCTFGLYDRPDVQSGTEQLILKSDGGSIGGLSSPRVVFSNENASFNSTFYDNLIVHGRLADGTVRRLGDVSFATKQLRYGIDGFEKFHLFADPAMRLAFPRYTSRVDSFFVNGVAVDPNAARIGALSNVRIVGTVLNADSTAWTDFSGTALVTLFDATRNVPVPEWAPWTYTVDGGVLYRGRVSISDGRFAAAFTIPKDISYENSHGRLTIYFDNGTTDGAGFTTAFTVGGSDTSTHGDSEGPTIALFLDNRSFLAGDLVSENPVLLADLEDANGINTTGLGIGHAIEAWIDGADPSIVLNDYYSGETDSNQRGTVRYALHDLADGRHTIRLRAWDIFNNSATAETWFTVASSASLAVQNVVPFPNPMTDATTFTFQHNQTDPVNVEIKIYTLSGLLLRTISEEGVGERFVRIPWDGRDGDGSKLANGTYFYKLICKTADGRLGSETLGKVAVLR